MTPDYNPFPSNSRLSAPNVTVKGQTIYNKMWSSTPKFHLWRKSRAGVTESPQIGTSVMPDKDLINYPSFFFICLFFRVYSPGKDVKLESTYRQLCHV